MRAPGRFVHVAFHNDAYHLQLKLAFVINFSAPLYLHKIDLQHRCDERNITSTTVLLHPASCSTALFYLAPRVPRIRQLYKTVGLQTAQFAPGATHVRRRLLCRLHALTDSTPLTEHPPVRRAPLAPTARVLRSTKPQKRHVLRGNIPSAAQLSALRVHKDIIARIPHRPRKHARPVTWQMLATRRHARGA